MAEKSKLSKLRLAIITAAVATGAFGTTALAQTQHVSEKDMLLQAIALYEKLSGSEVSVPQSLQDSIKDTELSKAVILGFANADEIDSLTTNVGLRKQDAVTVLYKTIIDYDDSFALSADEVDEIMNKCYDNALIDEENRVGYAFMLKHGIINNGSNTEPNKEITWESCRVLVDVIYDVFMQNTSFDANGTEVVIGSNIDTVTDVLGEPNRIDNSDYQFQWYVYNSDYNNFMMVGVDSGRICAFFSNSNGVKFNNIEIGGDYILTHAYAGNDDYRFFSGDNSTLDAFIYNPRAKSTSSKKVDSNTRSLEIADMINAQRAKQGFDALTISSSLWKEASAMPSQAKYVEAAHNNGNNELNDAIHKTGYDAISIFASLLKSNYKCFDKNVNAIGIGTELLDDYSLISSIKAEKLSSRALKESADINDISSLPTAEPSAEPTAEVTEAETTQEAVQTETATVEPTEVTTMGNSIFSVLTNTTDVLPVTLETKPTETAKPENTAEPTATEAVETTTEATTSPSPTAAPLAENAPIITLPGDNETVTDGEDVVIKLKESVADEYYVRIYSYEDDKYIVDSYIKTSEDTLTFDAALFQTGKDYSVSLSAVLPAETVEGNRISFSYGTAPEDAVKILDTAEVTETDDDFITLQWESSLYHDFVVDIYDTDGKLLISQPFNDTYSLKINGMDAGSYYIYVNAVRRGSDNVIKAQASHTVKISDPEPVITEYILEDGEKFYPIYEDSEMGLLYFYDEDIIDFETVNSKGKTVTEKRKKITEKKIKATEKYRRLAQVQQKVEYFEGSDKLDIQKPTTVNTPVYTNSSYNSADGQAIVNEAAKYLGVPYVWGGTSPSGFDCSGLVQYVCKSLGINLSRVTYTQVNEGVTVNKEDMQPGDLIFFANNGDVHHVGIYAGNGMMIHAPYTGAVIQYQSIDTPYYKSQFYCAKRVTGLKGSQSSTQATATPQATQNPENK